MMDDASMVQERKCDTACHISREVWVARICKAHEKEQEQQSKMVEAIFHKGRELLRAKRELPYGDFEAMIERELPFSATTARCYMAIAGAKHFQNATIGVVLPVSWRTLYELQRLGPSTFDAAVQAGKIHPEMTRAEAEALLPDGLEDRSPNHPVPIHQLLLG